MKHTLARIISFKRLGDYVVKVSFDDGSSQRIDFFPLLTGELFEPLQDKDFFSKVKIDPIAHTLTWPNGADFDPGMLHDWSQIKDEFQAQITGRTLTTP